ncbi:serine/threonine-protein kinase [Streptomyces canus]|uniref:serine/threonine-protein kinase n=1 Tax=Streptomyces canus TaxID=58343 RepID=UPI002E27F9CE|nr:PQQ-binding-like beta-propeller repeat protein [Streptomyces canus]
MQPLHPEDPEQLGPYRPVARLGAGGMGRVYLATSSAGRTVAVKVIRPEMAEDKNFRIRFRREVAAAAAVGGAYTASVVDAAPDDQTPWLATAYVPGPTVAEAVAAYGPLPVETVLALGAGIAEALIAVHAEGLVHRDLKPSNVLLAADGPRVIDFGIVRARDGYQLTGSGGLLGSLEYVCPEQATGDPVGPEGDVFCLGSVLAFAASGHAPFSGASAAALLYQVVHGSADLTRVPDPLDKIISLCHARDPALRISPDRLSAACAPGGADQVLTEGWLPVRVAAMVDDRRAAATDVERLARTLTSARPAADAAARASIASGRHGSGRTPMGPSSRGTDSKAGAADADRILPAGHADNRAAGGAGATGGAPPTADPPERRPPAAAAESAEPATERSAAPAHRRAPERSRIGRRTLLAVTAGAAVVGGTALVVGGRAGRQPARRPGPAPEPTWVYRGGPLLQTPAVFNDGTALLKSRPGNMICLDLRNGSQPEWVYQGISVSPSPVLLANDAAVALGTGATVIGVDPDGGTEKFSLDFGRDCQFDQLLGGYDGYVISVLGARLERRSEEQGVATSTSAVFGVDLRARRAVVIPIDPEDVGVPLRPVITSDYFVYADGLRNVTVRSIREDGGLRWRHPVGYDLRPGLAVLGRTVFAIGSEFIALDLATGNLRWKVKAERGTFASLGAGGNTVYATGTDPYGVHAFNAATGARRWFCETPRLNADHPVAVGAHTVHVPAFENRNGFYAIDAASGRLLWNFTDGRETGVNDWQLSCDRAGHLVAQHFDRAYGLPVT